MSAGFNALLGVKHIGLREDGYWIEIEACQDHVHDEGYVHGGVVLSLLDIAMSRAVRAGEVSGSYAPTIEISASFLRPLKQGLVRSRGKLAHVSRTLRRVEGAVLDAEGRISALGHAAFIAPR